mgnify:CR=1 FL=1
MSSDETVVALGEVAVLPPNRALGEKPLSQNGLDQVTEAGVAGLIAKSPYFKGEKK